MTWKRIIYADDDTSSINKLVRLRLPSLLIGLCLGIILAFVFSRFEEILSKDVRVAFFIPFVVYIAAAIGTQTQSIFARDLKSGRAKFRNYLWKESAIGIIFGLIAGMASALITFIWMRDPKISLVVGSSMLAAVAVAPLVALLVTEVMELEHLDPAVGTGPIATVIQDTLSVLIYGLIASYVLL